MEAMLRMEKTASKLESWNVYVSYVQPEIQSSEASPSKYYWFPPRWSQVVEPQEGDNYKGMASLAEINGLNI